MTDDVEALQPAIAETLPTGEAKEADASVAKPEGADPATAAAETSEAPKRDKTQERIHKLTREKYDAFYERDRERAERERVETRLRELETAKTQPVAPDELPTLESVGYDEEKLRTALAGYFRAQARDEAKQVLERERAQVRERERAETFDKRQREFESKHPDYREKVIENLGLSISADMAQVILTSEMGPQVAYYLGDNPDIARSIAQLPLADAARELGRIEARIELEAKKPPPPPRVSQAPPPVPKLDAVETTVAKEPQEMNQSEFNKWRKKFINR